MFISFNLLFLIKQSWIVQNYQDREEIKVFLNSSVDTSGLQELKMASVLVEAPNVDKKPDEENLRNMFNEKQEMKERNKQILKAYETGYSQHMIAKVLDISQPAVYGVIKRSRKYHQTLFFVRILSLYVL